MTRRILAILVLVSVATPWAAVCVPGAPGAMPCCTRPDAGAPPALKACCGPGESKPATPQTSVTSVAQAPLQTAAFFSVVPAPSTRAISAPAARAVRTEIRLLNSVFLI